MRHYAKLMITRSATIFENRLQHFSDISFYNVEIVRSLRFIALTGGLCLKFYCFFSNNQFELITFSKCHLLCFGTTINGPCVVKTKYMQKPTKIKKNLKTCGVHCGSKAPTKTQGWRYSISKLQSKERKSRKA